MVGESLSKQCIDASIELQTNRHRSSKSKDSEESCVEILQETLRVSVTL